MEYFMKKFFKFIVPILLTALILCSIFWYCFIYDRNFTRDMLLTQARYHSTEGNPRIGSWFYDTAYKLSDQNDGVAIELANQFMSAGNYSKAESTLTHAIADGATTDLYVALCKTYVRQDKLLDAVTFLDSVTDPVIKAELEALRPAMPTATPEPGFYTEYIDVNLAADGGYVYYSTDVEYPSIADGYFAEAIKLPIGETVIKTVAVNSKGLVSPLTTFTYTVGGVVEEVIFTDQAIEMAIRQQINADAEDTIFTNMLWDIKDFTVPEGAVNLQDLTYLPYVERLNIANQTLDTVDFLISLSNLKDLNLTGCRFASKDLEIIACMPNLVRLTIADCGLSTLAGLENAQNLTYLDMSNNTVRNLEPLSTLANLQTLKMGHNALTNLNAISTLTGLTELDVSFNALTTLAPLSGCWSMNSLLANNNQINTLEGIDRLSELRILNLNKNQLTDVSILAGNTALVELNFGSNSVTDISSLSTLTNLELFTFSFNQATALPAWPDGSKLRSIDGTNNLVESLDNLKNMHSLTHILMDYNKITSVDPVANCYSLVQINVYGNAIPNVDSLKDREIIVNWDPTLAEETE